MPSPQSVLTDQVKLYTRSRDISWAVDHLPPNTRIYLFINGQPFSQYAAPRGGGLGDAIFSNEFGHAEGQLTIPRNAEEKFLVGEIRLTFADNATDIALSTFTVESTFYSISDAEQFNTDQGGTRTTRQPIPFRRAPSSNLREADSYNNNITYTSNRLDLVAQTFNVDATIYPQGLFVSSADLFFVTVDSAMPVSVELRNTVNGIPVGDSYISGSYVLKYPSEIAIAVQTAAGITTVQVQNAEILDLLNAFAGSLVYRGVLLETYLQQYAPLSSGAVQETLSVTNIYDSAQPSANGLFLTLLPGYANYVIERRNPIETYNLSLDPLPAGVATLPNSARTYTDPRSGTKYSSGVTIGVNFMVRNGVLYKFPEPPDNTVVFNVSGGNVVTAVELEYTSFADEIIAGTNVGYASTAASTSLDTAGRFPATNFQFEHPIYLAPGTYAICIRTNSNNYNVATSRADLELLSDSGPRVPESLTGALFRAGNAGGRTPDFNEDLCFVLYKCKFDTGIRSLFLDNKAPDTEFRYDAFMLKSTTLEFPGVSYIDKKVSHRSAEGQAGIFTNTLVNNITTMDYRSTIASEGDLALEMIFHTDTEDLSPVVDKEKLLGIMFRNVVGPFEQDTSDSELTPDRGVANARYVSKMISLLPGFESNGMEVRVDVNRKIGTDIEVFVKVLAPKDTEPANKRPWKRMKLVSNDGTKQFVGFSDNEYVTEYYQLLDPELQYEDTTNLGENNVPGKFTEFNRYIIKVVFYSQNTTFVPKIKNLFASACIDVPSEIVSSLGSGTSSLAGLKINSSDLLDISNQAPSDGQLLIYNSQTGLWEPKNAPAAATYKLDDLTDVNAPNPQQDYVLTWTGNEWEPAAAGGQLQGVGNAPFYGCRAWVNFNGGGVIAIRAHGNVDMINDYGTGYYGIVFDIPMDDADYATVAFGVGGVSGRHAFPYHFGSPTAEEVKIVFSDPHDNRNRADQSIVSVVVFR